MKTSRRSFVAGSLALGLCPPTQLFANLSPSPKPFVSPDRRFMSYHEHIQRVGEDEALWDLGRNFFPVTCEQTMWACRGTPKESMTDDLARYYKVSEKRRIKWGKVLSQNPWRVTNCPPLFRIQERSEPVRHWWLLGTRARDTTTRLWIVHVYSDHSPEYFNAVFKLTTRIRDRMHRHRKSISHDRGPWLSLIQLVNQEIKISMRNLPA